MSGSSDRFNSKIDDLPRVMSQNNGSISLESSYTDRIIEQMSDEQT
jgi:hypothetical protein